MKTYKTLKGLLNQTTRKSMRVSEILEGDFYHKTNGITHFELSENAMNEFCKIISEYCFSTKQAQRKMIDVIKNHYYDSSLLQCFYIHIGNNGNIYASNSLSGEAFISCTRRFIR